MASDQKCVTGDGEPSASKYDTLWKICHQLLKKSSDGMTSGRSLVSSAWLKIVHSTAMVTTENTIAGNSLRMRLSQKSGRLMRPVPWNSITSRLVMRYPDRTKKIVTPRSPPVAHGMPMW